MKILKNSSKAGFDSSKEVSWCIKRNAKDPSSLQRTVSKKIKKNLQKWLFSVFLVKLDIFRGYSNFFSKTILCKELWSFALHSVHQDAFFELSKTVFLQFFWISYHKGPFWLRGGSRFQPRRRRGQKKYVLESARQN